MRLFVVKAVVPIRKQSSVYTTGDLNQNLAGGQPCLFLCADSTSKHILDDSLVIHKRLGFTLAEMSHGPTHGLSAAS